MSEVRTTIRSCALVGLLLAACFADLRAQVRLPSLNGHRFVTSELVDDPFVATHFVNQLGVGFATNSEFPLYVFEGDTLTAPRGTQIFAVIRFDYQQRVQEWISARFSFQTLARMGTDAISLLGAGVTASTEMRFDWKIGLLRSEKSSLALDVGLLNQNTTYVDIAGFINDIIDREDASLVESIPAIRATLGLRYAHAFNPVLGVVVSGDLLIGENAQDRDSDAWAETTIAAGLSVNGHAKGIPLGAFLAYSFSSDSFDQRSPNERSQIIELKIIYSEPGDFMIGPAVYWASLPGFFDNSLTFLNVSLRSRYYF